MERKINNERQLIEDFIRTELWDLQEEASMALDMCEEEGSYHMVSYWINGTYENVGNFLKDNYSESLLDMIIEMYPGGLDSLISKMQAVYDVCNNERLAYEGLASILLQEMQHYPEWYTVYGSEEVDMIDFSKYNINNALNDKDEFPVMKREDIVAAMYGINDTAQPSDMYDIFAHYADDLKFKKDSLFDEKQSIFTPDLFLVAAVVARYKNYIELTRTMVADYAMTFTQIMNYDESIRYIAILGSVVSDYKNRYSSTPYGVPLHKDMIKGNIIEIDGIKKIAINYSIRGVRDKAVCWDNIAEITYDIPLTAKEYKDLIIQIAIDFKREVNGLEKERNKDVEAISGKYPNRFSATHGLTFMKDINTHKKDARGRDYKKVPKVNFNLSLAEKQSLYVIKKSLRYADKNPVISSSFGIDSITTLHLLRRVNKHNYNIVFNNSLVEYPELIKYKKKISALWELEDKIIETKPVETYWELQKRNGWNFLRKGDRRYGKSNSEECCNKIKHIPMYNQIDKFIAEGNPMQVNFSGLRAGESRAREQAMKRDNIVYYAKNWKTIRVNPIGFYTDQMVWDYVEKHNIEYCDVYDMKLYYEDVYDNVSEEEYGKVYYQPRIGCWSCSLNTSRGYMQWLKRFYPKQYDFMMIKKGMARVLFEKGAKQLGIIADNIIVETPKKEMPQLSFFETEELKLIETPRLTTEQILDRYPIEQMEAMIMKRPCKFLA